MTSPLERMLSRTRTDGDCLVWTGSKMWSGYGVFSFHGRQQRVHRVSYILQVGEIPTGMHVLHKCDNRACIKPEHLFLGTHADNMHDKTIKGRCKTKVTAEMVKEMRAAIGVKQEDLADRFGISAENVCVILARKTWRHVE